MDGRVWGHRIESPKDGHGGEENFRREATAGLAAQACWRDGLCLYSRTLLPKGGWGWELLKLAALLVILKCHFKDILEWHRMSKRQTPRRWVLA